jgi:hypothetical protein
MYLALLKITRGMRTMHTFNVSMRLSMLVRVALMLKLRLNGGINIMKTISIGRKNEFFLLNIIKIS